MKTDMSDIDSRIVSALEKLTQIQRILLWDKAKIEGLSPIQIQILIYIKRYKGEQCRVSNLAREFDLTKATISDAVKTLDEKALISKSQKKSDKRSYVIDLTERGKEVVGRIENWQRILVDHIKFFSSDKKEIIMVFLMELIKSLYDDGIISISRMCIACENFVKDLDSNNQKHFCRLTGKTLMNNDLNIGCLHYKQGAQ